MALAAPPEIRLWTLAECLDGDGPFAVRAVDAERGGDRLQLQPSRSGEPYQRLIALVRRDGCALGWARAPVDGDGIVELGALSELIERSPAALEPPVPADRGDELLTVVVATCAQVESVTRCVDAILVGDDGPLEVVVVENRPWGSSVRETLRDRYASEPSVRCVEEPRQGLARARNAGLRAARGSLIAFTDDDVVVDPSWIPAIRDAFAAHPLAHCVTGLIAPLELETPEQVALERFANYGKGFVQRTYTIHEPPPDQPLFPYTAGHLGSGANMAFRTEELRNLGGFDPALGTGTPARGSEDLDICIRVLRSGAELVYEPRALIWHRHPDTQAGLRQRAFDYGVALGSLLSKHMLVETHRWDIYSRIPEGVRYMLDPNSRKNASRGPDFPPSLVWLERLGLLYSPLAYLRSRLAARR